MNSTKTLQAAGRQPLIKFLGKRSTPKTVDHTPRPHPASEGELPMSFAQYRAKAQQHGPLTGHRGPPQRVDANPYGAIGGTPGHNLGPVKPPQGTFFDRSELPKRFQRLEFSSGEIDVINAGGAPA